MKHILLFSIFLIISITSFAQTGFSIKGRLIDKSTKEPLPYANIIYLKKAIGTTSNLDGIFQLHLNDANEKDSIRIQYIGYSPLILTLKEAANLNTFQLYPKLKELAEVKVKPQKFKLRKFIKTSIDLYNKNKRNEPHIAYGHYREYASYNNKYVMFTEALGYSIYSSTRVNISPLANYNFFCQNTKYASSSTWVDLFSKTGGFSTNYKKPSLGSGSNLNVFRRVELKGVLSASHWSKFSFKLDSNYYLHNSSILRIAFKRGKQKGMIHISTNNNQILKIEQTTKMYWNNLFRTKTTAHLTIDFNYFDETPFIAGIEAYSNYNNVEYTNKLTILSQKLNHFSITGREFWALNNSNFFIKYLPKKWEEQNIPICKKYDQIEQDLKQNTTTLDEQFKQYSDKWFHPDASNKPERAILLIKKLEEIF
ncbi:carboxypeptidase-like regulatory domain-containing protein [Prolixibacteraceae bacterium JC049]|nr:carboxypeptidase-like regulatory domain-containing protein [Prolixibacteraceae bacterium JC049]